MMPLRTPPRSFARVGLSALLLLLAGGCAIVSEKPSYCTETRDGGFGHFLEEDWRDHCERWRQAVEAPGELGFGALTTFFGEHARRRAQLEEELARFDEPRACFASEKEKLELRSLEACLADDEAADQAMLAAFAYHAEPWIEGHRLRLRQTRPEVGDLGREAERLVREVGEAFDYHTPMEPGPLRAFEEELAELHEAVEAAGRVEAEHRSLLERARGNPAIVAALHREYGPRVAELMEEVSELRSKLEAIDDDARFIAYGAGAAGKPCPAGEKAPKQEKIARKLLGKELRPLDDAVLRIAKHDRQRLDGFVCARRGEANQFADAPPMCGLYRFSIERGRGGPWQVASFEESGPQDGVDCAKLAKAKK